MTRKFPELEIPDFMKLSKSPSWNPKLYSPLVFDEKIKKWSETLKPGTLDYDDFWEEMDFYCFNGFAPKGMPRITGRHFYYLNMNRIKLLPKGKKDKILANPNYRDLDHWVFLEIECAIKNGYGLILAKPRQIGLSELGVINVNYTMTFNYLAEAAIAAGKDEKVQEFKQKLISSLNNVHPSYRNYIETNNDKLMEMFYYDVVNKQKIPSGINTKARFKTMFADSGAFEGINNNKIAIFEEAGLFENIAMSYKATEPSFRSGAIQYGLPMVYGCVCAGTKVWDNNGNLVNIENLKQENGILGYNSKEISKEPIVWMKPPAKKPCYKITTTGGDFIECSNDHPLLSFLKKTSYNKKQATFKKAEDLRVGDKLLTPTSFDFFGNKNIKDARLLGLLIGDGNYTKNQIPQLAVGDIEIGNYIKKRYDCKTYKTKIKLSGGVYESIGIKGIKNLLIDSGIYGQVKKQKRLPKNINEYNEKSIRELISGYYDADGNVKFDKNKNCVVVVLSSIVEELLIEVKMQLFKLGIDSSICKEKRNIKLNDNYKGQQNHIYRLYINKQEDVLLFSEKISFLCLKKQETLNIIKSLSRKSTCKKNEYEFVAINDKGSYFLKNNNLKNLKEKRITKIEFLGDKEIYNLNAGITHTYISNGFISANTGGEIEKGSKGYKEMWDQADAYNLKRIFIPAYYYYPGDGIPDEETKKTISFFNHETGVTNRDAAKKYILKERKIAERSKDTYIKHIQSFPLIAEEVFLKTKGGILDLKKLNFQLKEINSQNEPEPVLRGILEWEDDPKTTMILERAKNTKEKTKIRVNNGSRVKFKIHDEGYMYKMGSPINKSVENFLSYKPDIGGCDSYDEEVDQDNPTISSGCIMAYRCFSGPTRDFNYPVGFILERGDGSFDEDTFYEHSVMFAIYWDMEVLIEYTKFHIMRYFYDVGAGDYVRQKPINVEGGATENHKNKDGVKMDGRMKKLATILLKLEVKDNIHKYWMALIILDLIKYGDENTDIASALIMCLIFRMDIFEEITEDIENLNDPVDSSGFGENSGRYYVDLDGKLKTDMNSNFKMQQFIPHRDMSKSQYEAYVSEQKKSSEDLIKRRELYEQTSTNESMMEMLRNEQLKWLENENKS